MRVSVTEIDSYLYWRQSEDMPLEDLVARLRKQTEPSEQMLAGIALHSALEKAQPGSHAVMEHDGYRFMFNLETDLALPDLREIKAEKVYRVAGMDVELVGKVDAIHGTRVEDHKTTGRMDLERYFAGYQWRFYLDMFGADIFRWNIFEVDEREPKSYVVFGFHQAEQTRYPGMEADCLAVLADFAVFVRDHLPERLTGEPPPAAPTLEDQLRASLRKAARMLAELGPATGAAVPADRYEHARALAQHFAQRLEQERRDAERYRDIRRHCLPSDIASGLGVPLMDSRPDSGDQSAWIDNLCDAALSAAGKEGGK